MLIWCGVHLNICAFQFQPYYYLCSALEYHCCIFLSFSISPSILYMNVSVRVYWRCGKKHICYCNQIVCKCIEIKRQTEKNKNKKPLNKLNCCYDIAPGATEIQSAHSFRPAVVLRFYYCICGHDSELFTFAHVTHRRTEAHSFQAYYKHFEFYDVVAYTLVHIQHLIQPMPTR